MTNQTPYEVLDAMLDGDWEWTQKSFVVDGATCTLGRLGQVVAVIEKARANL